MWRKHQLSNSPANQSTSLMIIFFILIVFGLIMLTLTTPVAGHDYKGDNFYYLKHQLLFGLLPGLFFFFLCAKIPYKFWQKNAGLVFLIAIILLVLVFVPNVGLEKNHAKSWINLGIFSFQPSEIMKLSLIIYLSVWFTKSKQHIKSFSHGLLPFLILVGIIAGLVALQPDMGTMSIIILVAFGIYFAAGLKWSHFFGLILISSGLFFLLIKVMIKIDPDGRHLKRILTFLNPSSTNLQDAGYHINQALIAVGSGGLFGRGLGGSRQIFGYLPEVQGDSIFAAIAEELGFFLTTIFIIFLFILIFKILRLAHSSQDNFIKFFAIGIALWIGVQTIVNVGAMIGILPLTGVPLPFVSFGGTALMILMASFGILINMLKK